jgi:CheY-like chemotaxis protein
MVVAAGVGAVAVVLVGAARRGGEAVVDRVAEELTRLRTIDEARIRFFGNITHELRTPLTLILGQIDAALVEKDPDQRAHRLRVAARQARRLQRLADQALQLTQLGGGTLPSHPAELDVVPYLESLVMSFEELAERSGIRLEFIARPRSLRAALDRDHLTTIVSNLVSNALKYTPADGRVGVAVEARAAEEDPAGRGRLSITVADSGPGIPPEQHAAIFEPFVRGEEADRRHPGGAGIGLALVSELARLDGGRVSLQSAPGRGARFVVELPIDVPPDLEVARSARPPLVTGGDRPAITAEILYRTTDSGEDGPTEPSDARPTLLVVDDSADLRDWIARELDPVGAVIQAADGAEALERAGELLPDLVVTDARMRDLDGFELCRRLQSDERTSHIPIVMLTVMTSVERRLEGIEAGADAYLEKPVDGRELRARVTGLLAKRDTLRERFRARVVVKPSEVSARPVDQLFFEKVMSTIEARMGEADFSVSELADEMAMSTSQLTRKLRALIDQAPGQLIRSVRLQRAADLVAAGAGNISTIAYRVGFSDQAHFTRTFKRHMGMTPSEYRRDSAAADSAS